MTKQGNVYTVILREAEEGGYIAKCVELPVVTEGETRDEALKNAKEAIELYIEEKFSLYLNSGEREEIFVSTPSALMA
ncbi:MAG: type II toxin-antitoxin system HicB family antitoxin [Nitrososphaeria archaeon]